MKSETKFVRIDELITDGLQIRVALDEEVIREYAWAMNKGMIFPPVVVFGRYLADGFLRVEAAKLLGYEAIYSEVHEGDFLDALRFALTASWGHGSRRTLCDRQRALELAWAHRTELFPARVVGKVAHKAGNPTVRELAKACGVSLESSQKFLMLKAEQHKAARRKIIVTALRQILDDISLITRELFSWINKGGARIK